MAQPVNCGSGWSYSWQGLAGMEPGGQSLYEMAARRSRPGEVVLTSFGDRRDRTAFAAAYNDPESGITTGPRPPAPVCTAPLAYAGQEMIKADIANFQAALKAAGVTEGFMTAGAPGSCHGAHLTDIPLKDIIEVALAANVGAISFEAGNVRHEHEWRVWQEVKLPDDKVILPGVVSHATNVVEHPELVADRICRFADIVGRERVIASTDCGLGGRVHPQVA